MAIKRINDQLKAMLPPDVFKALETAFEKADVVIEVTDGYIPKERFDQVNTDLKEYKGKYESTVADIDKFQKAAKGNEELTSLLEKTKAEHAAEKQRYEQLMVSRERDFLMKDALREAGVKNPKAVIGLLEHEKIALKDGKLDGLDVQLEAIKKTDGYLFVEKQNPNPSSVGREPNPAFNTNSSGKGAQLDPAMAKAFGIKTETPKS